TLLSFFPRLARRPLRSALFPYTTLFRSKLSATKSVFSSTPSAMSSRSFSVNGGRFTRTPGRLMWRREPSTPGVRTLQRIRFRFRSEEHTSELQSRFDLVCRLLLEKKNKD